MPADLDLPVLRAASHGLTVDAVAVHGTGSYLYAGCRTTDPLRRGLVAFPLAGTELGEPRFHPQHPFPLPTGHSEVTAVVWDPRFPRKLYLGVAQSPPVVGLPALVVYDLDERGAPVGVPRALRVDGGTAGAACWAIALHPARPMLYAGGWGTPGVAVVPLAEDGTPLAEYATAYPHGHPPRSLAVRWDEATGRGVLYAGTQVHPAHPWAFWLADLDPNGLPLVLPGHHATYLTPYSPGGGGEPAEPEGRPGYGHLDLTLCGDALYFRSPAPGHPLAYVPLGGDGRPAQVYGPVTDRYAAVSTALGDVAGLAASGPGRLLVAATVHATDARTGERVPDGLALHEYAPGADGAPGEPVAAAATLHRLGETRPAGDPRQVHQPVVVAGTPHPALAVGAIATPPPNRFTGLAVRVRLRDTRPRQVVSASLAARTPGTPPRTLERDLGELAAGGAATGWVRLDDLLADGAGPAALTVTLQPVPAPGAPGLPGAFGAFGAPAPAAEPAPVAWAEVEFETALVADGSDTPVRTATAAVDGPVAALVVPRYRSDGVAGPADVAGIARQVQTSAERYAWYRDRAAAVRADRRPGRFLVANLLFGMDSSAEALDLGMQALALLGHNAVDASFPGLPAERVRSAAREHGLTRFVAAVPAPPHYFSYATELVGPGPLDAWAADTVADVTGQLTPDAGEIALVLVGDEPGWYFPQRTGELHANPRWLAAFRAYLAARGLTPQRFGFDHPLQLVPVDLSAAYGQDAPLASRMLLYWTARFFADAFAETAAATSRALRRHTGNPALLTAANCNNVRSEFYVPAPYLGAGHPVGHGNNPEISRDTASGAPDWFTLARPQPVTDPDGSRRYEHGVSCLFTEDWFADQDAQSWSFRANLMRSVARREGLPAFGGYVVGATAGAVPGGATYKVMTLAGHGASVFGLYNFGPAPAGPTDAWSEGQAPYAALGEAAALLARAEPVLSGGTARPGTVGVVLPAVSRMWDPSAAWTYHQAEPEALHRALSHAHFPVEVLDDDAVAADPSALAGLRTLYLTGPNLTARALHAVLEWVRGGGHAVLLPGAATADEYNSASTVMAEAIGAPRRPVPRLPAPRPDVPLRAEPVRVEAADARFPASLDVRTQAVRLDAGRSGHVLARYGRGPSGSPRAGTPAVVGYPVGAGLVTAYGFWPGVDYAGSAARLTPRRLPQDWSAPHRAAACLPAEVSGAGRHVRCSVPAVEVLLLESAAGTAVTLLNWTGHPLGEVAFTVHHSTGHHSTGHHSTGQDHLTTPAPPSRQGAPVDRDASTGTPTPASTAGRTVTSCRGTALTHRDAPGGIEVVLPLLDTVDVVLVGSG